MDFKRTMEDSIADLRNICTKEKELIKQYNLPDDFVQEYMRLHNEKLTILGLFHWAYSYLFEGKYISWKES